MKIIIYLITTQILFAKNIDGIIKIYARLARKIKSICINNNFPIVISGDHSSAGGIIEGLKASHPNKKLGVIWIDAHADFAFPFNTLWKHARNATIYLFK